MELSELPKYSAHGAKSHARPQEIRRFHNFCTNLTTGELFKSGARLEVEPKVFQLLGLLLRVPGELVTYQELKEAIWPDVVIELSENANVLASKLREALAEIEGGTRYVLNRRGQGYYFNPRVTVESLVLTPEPKTAITPDGPIPPGSQPWKWWLLCAAAAIILAVLTAAFWPQHEMADFRVQGRNLIALDSKARELWRYAFPWDLRETAYANEERSLHTWIGKLDGTGRTQLLFNAVSYRPVDFGTPVFCFGPKGKVEWQFVPGRPVIDGTGDKMVPPYPSNTLLVARGLSDTETRVVISSNHYLGQADQVAFLSPDGHVVGEYWHPGHLLHLKQVDLDGKGRDKLILAGVNNGNHQATIVVVDPLKVAGIGTPKTMQDHRFELMNMAASHEEAVVFFPRSCISAGQSYTRVSDLHVNKDRIIATVSEGIAERNEGFVYELDYHLGVVNVVPTNGVNVEKIHWDLEAQGKLDHRFNLENECARLKAGVIVR